MSVAAESPLQDEVRALVSQLNDFAFSLTPPEFCYHLTVEQMDEPAFTLFVARDGGQAVGIGGVRIEAGGLGEIKRMFVKPAQRGQAIAEKILRAIEAFAQGKGLARLVLETGSNFDAAKKLYEKSGYRRCAPFLDYVETEWNIFYEKPLS